MKIKLILFCSLSLFGSLLIGVTLEIKQDGTGDYTTIQAGINSATHSDTILVYPGTYYENVDFSGKNIVLNSLYQSTQDQEYIHNTIINGNQTGSCVRAITGEDSTATIDGFTLTNGSGTLLDSTGEYKGGGCYVNNSELSIINCKIFKNYASSGGAIYLKDSRLQISGTTIQRNFSNVVGGGLLINRSEVIFSPENLCNIYLNYSCRGADIYRTSNSSAVEVFVDTFTVIEPTLFQISSDELDYHNEILINIQYGKIEPVDADLYVSPNGDNNNSGLSPDYPLRNIYYAQMIIEPDSLNPNTIFLADGLYSKSSNQEHFPLGMREFTSLIGTSRENTILDAENNMRFFSNRRGGFNYSLENFTCTNANSNERPHTLFFSALDAFHRNREIGFRNIKITNTQNANSFLLEIHDINYIMENVIFEDNQAFSLRQTNSLEEPINANYVNCTIRNNSNNQNDIMFLGLGNLGYLNTNLINCEISGNTSKGIGIYDQTNLTIVNSTITDNFAPNSHGAISVAPSTTTPNYINIYNSVFYDNIPAAIYLDNQSSYGSTEVNIYNSFFENGTEDIVNEHQELNMINWCGENLEGNPDFSGNNTDYPFALAATSPAINAGTLDLPEGIELPEYDLAGNPRIYGAGIDMGAYEYQGEPQSAEEDELIIPQANKISSYPNPFYPQKAGRSGSTIFLELAESGQIEFAIYNIKGQKVKSLLDAYSSQGRFELQWNGKDDEGKPVASGTYLLKLAVNDELRQAKKITVLK